MPQKATKNQTEQQARAALDAIARHGWRHLTLNHLQRGKKISLTKGLRSKKDLLPIIARYADQRMQKNLSPSPDGPATDRLFDIMMARFDVFQDHRAAMKALFRELPLDPPALAALLPCLHRSAGIIVAHGGPGKCPHLERLAVFGVMSATARVWLRDESPDMSKTMSALNRHLEQAQRLGLFKAAGE